MTSPVAAAGLVLDVVGAVVLASAFAFKRPRDVLAESQASWDYSSTLMVSLAKQTADAWVGGALLALGFLGQFAQSVGWEPGWARLALMVPLAGYIAVIVVLFLHLVVRPWNVGRALAFLLTTKRNDADNIWFGAIRSFAMADNRDFKFGERPADRAIAMMGPKRWARVTEGMTVPLNVSDPWTPNPPA